MLHHANKPDVRGFYAALGLRLAPHGTRDSAVRCFANPQAHNDGDRHPSASVSMTSGAWCCHGCGARGGAYDAARARGHTPRSAIDLMVEHGLTERRRGVRAASRMAARVSSPPFTSTVKRALPSDAELAHFAHVLSADQRCLTHLGRERRWSVETIERFGLGLDRDRIVIPVRHADGEVVAVLRYDPRPDRRGPKMIAVAGSRRTLYPAPETLNSHSILVVEGEPDALAAHSAGLPATAIPGTHSWRAAWARRCHGHRVVVVADSALDGRRLALRVVADLHAAGISATGIDLHPHREDGADLTDWLRTHQVSELGIEELVKRATPLLV